MKILTLDQPTRNQIVQEWRDVLDRLVAEISGWTQDQPGWSVRRSTTDITEDGLGSYEAPVLTIDADGDKIIIEPMARIGFGGTGTVEMYAWPTLYRVRLLHKDNWEILTDSGIKLRQPWNKDTFIGLIKDLLGAP